MELFTSKDLAKKIGCSQSLIRARAAEIVKNGHGKTLSIGHLFFKSAIEYMLNRPKKKTGPKPKLR